MRLNDLDQKWRIKHGLEPLTAEEVESAKAEAELYPSVWYATAQKPPKRLGDNFIRTQREYHGSGI